MLHAILAAVFQWIARKQIPIPPLYAVSSAVALMLSLSTVQWDRVASEQNTSLLAIVMAGAGFANAGAVGSGILAMGLGHSAITFAIVQSSMLVSFLYAALAWDESIDCLKMVGMALIVGMFLLVGPWRKDGSERIIGDPKWFPACLSSAMLGGIAQVLYILPSRWPCWNDTAGLRVPLFMFGMLSAFTVCGIVQRRHVKRVMLFPAALIGILTAGSLFVLVLAIDRLTPLKMAGLIYPVTIAGGVLLYSLYSFVWLKEPFSARHWSGLIAGIIGIMLLCVTV